MALRPGAAARHAGGRDRRSRGGIHPAVANMDTVLIVLTCASAAAAVAFGFSAWRARGDEARRSAARVAALSAAIDASEPLAPAAPANHPVAVTSMFATAPGASVQGRPLMKMGVVAGLATALLV